MPPTFSSPAQRALRWLLLLPAAVCIAIVSQAPVLMVGSLFTYTPGGLLTPRGVLGLLNVLCVPYAVITFGAQIAPSHKTYAAGALAVVAVIIVALDRASREIMETHYTAPRLAWLACSAALCLASVVLGLRSVKKKAAMAPAPRPQAPP